MPRHKDLRPGVQAATHGEDDGGPPAAAALANDQRSLVALQRSAGNAAVVHLVQRGEVPLVVARDIPPHAPPLARTPSVVLPASPSDLIRSQAPQLFAALPDAERRRFVRLARAWAELERIGLQLEATRGSILSTDARQRERLLDRQRVQLDVVIASRTLAVPTERLMDDDILARPSDRLDAREVAFRSQLYRRLLEHPLLLEPVLRREGDAVVCELAQPYVWGPHRWTINHAASGTVSWQHLMQVQVWNLEATRINLAQQEEVLADMEQLTRSAGGARNDLTGRTLGQIPGWAWGTDVEIRQEVGPPGGFADDSVGRTELLVAIGGGRSAQAVIRAPDGWLHLYALDNQLRPFMDFGGSGDADGRARLRASGTIVPAEVVQIVGREGTEFVRDAQGWSAPMDRNALTSLERFAIGAVFGDFFEEPDVQSTLGQIFVGVIPIVGQVGDARDVAAGVLRLWQTGGRDGKLQTALALVGFVPLFGDAIKGSSRAGRAAVGQVVHEWVPRARSAFARALDANPSGVARAFGVPTAHRAVADLRGTLVRATAGDATATRELARSVGRELDAVGDTASLVVHAAGGSWAELAKALARSPDGAALGGRMQQWRHAEIEQLRQAMEQLPRGTGGVGAPHIERTGTNSYLSDVDLSFMGPDAAHYAQAAQAHLARRFGQVAAGGAQPAGGYEAVRKLLDLDIFTDPTRLMAFQRLPPAAAARVEAALVRESELNVLARMLTQHVAPPRVRQHAAAIGADMAAVSRRADELRALSANPARRQALELQGDWLQRRLTAATDADEQRRLAERMARQQALVNASAGGAYVTPGGVAAHVALRDPAIARDARGWVRMTPGMRYMTVLDDLGMLEHVLADVTSAGTFSAKSAKDMVKYADRLLVRAGQLGATDMAALTRARELYNQVGGLLEAARSNPADVVVRAGELLTQARGLLVAELDDLIPRARRLGTATVEGSGQSTTATGGRAARDASAGEVTVMVSQQQTVRTMTVVVAETISDADRRRRDEQRLVVP